MRKNRVSIFINVFAAILAVCGLFGASKLKWKLSLTHSIMTIGIIGAFLVYEVLYAMFGKKKQIDEYQIRETWLLLVLSLPYLIDFIIGIYGAIFTVNLIDTEKREENGPDNQDLVNEEQMNQELVQLNKNLNDAEELCCVCLANPRNSVFIPCGHQCTCHN
mmetsp:Transcript_38058/g.37558  ORF Transcript_38058/g.37558 Transcript_38058/m.37558 type:complete len:162 (-) Transcript_38058:11-496(-)